MAPVINDMMAGVMEAAIVDFAAGGSVLKAGTLRPLAVCSDKRFEALLDVPTVNEALGLKGFQAYAWQGVVVPAKTPDPIVAKLIETLAGALQQEAVRTRMKEIGLDPLSGGPAEVPGPSQVGTRCSVAGDPGSWPLIRVMRARCDSRAILLPRGSADTRRPKPPSPHLD